MRDKAKDLVVGKKIDSDYLLTVAKTGVTVKGTGFLIGSISDITGSMHAVWWEYDGKPYSGVVHIVGEVETDKRNGGTQLKIQSISPRTTTSDEEFEKISKHDPESMWQTIQTAITNIDNADIRMVLSCIFYDDRYTEAFKCSPAATGMHHAFKHGLLEHTSQMVETVDALFKLHCYYSNLNKDLCMFGVLMHDFCKIFEYSQKIGYPKTIQGILVPHIPMGGAIIYETCVRFGVPEVIRDHMMHVVLAHHGQQEYGSPVDMAIPEAGFVHYIDHLHGDVFGWLQKIETSKGEFEQVFNRKLVVKRFDDILQEIARGNML